MSSSPKTFPYSFNVEAACTVGRSTALAFRVSASSSEKLVESIAFGSRFFDGFRLLVISLVRWEGENSKNYKNQNHHKDNSPVLRRLKPPCPLSFHAFFPPFRNEVGDCQGCSLPHQPQTRIRCHITVSRFFTFTDWEDTFAGRDPLSIYVCGFADI